VQYKEGAEEKLKAQLNLTNTIDTADLFHAKGELMGVMKGLENQVAHKDISCWGPPADAPVRCDCP